MRELDEYLKDAAGELRDYHLSTLPKQPPSHTFSDKFETNMRHMLQQERLTRKGARFTVLFKRSASVLLAAAIGIFASVASVGVWSGVFFEMIEQRYPDHTRITFDKAGADIASDMVLTYELTGIPDGFRRVQHGNDPLHGFLNYAYFENDQEQRIMFDQNLAAGTAIALNTEGADMEDIKIGEKPGKLLENIGMCTVLWYDDQYCYTVTTDLPREQTITLAQTVKLKARPYSTAQALPIESLPEQYPASVAIENGDVVFDGDQIHHLEKLEEFITAGNEGKQAVIRLVEYKGNHAVISDLESKDGRIYYTRDEHRWPGSEQPWELGEEYEGISLLEGGGKRVLLHTRRYNDPVEVVKY